MAFRGLNCAAILLFLSTSHARPGGMAYYDHWEDSPAFGPSDPITSVANAPSPTTLTPEPSDLAADYTPLHDTTITSSSSPTPSGSPPHSVWLSGAHPGAKVSYYPVYDNSSTTGNTAAYGTAVPSHFPSDNYSLPLTTAGGIGGQSAGCNCPPPSTLMIPDTISIQPITVTVTSTVTSSLEPPPSPQVTRTLTTTTTVTMCHAGNEQNPSKGDNGPSAAMLSGGGQGSIGGPITDSGGPDVSSIPSSGLVPIVETTPAPKLIHAQEHPEVAESETGVQSYRPPFTNGTGSLEPLVQPGTGEYQALGIHGSPASTVAQMLVTSVPNSQEQPQLSSSGGTNFGGATTSAAATAPLISSLLDEEPGGQQTSVPDPGQSIYLPSGGQISKNTQVVPGLSSQMPHDNEPAIPTTAVPGQTALESLPVGPSALPPYRPVNSTSSAPTPIAGFPISTNTLNPITSIVPPFANWTSTSLPLGPNMVTGQLHLPSTNTAPSFHSSVLSTIDSSSLAPLQTQMYPVAPDISISTIQNISIPASGSVVPSEIPLSSDPVYATVTMEVLPIPLATTANSISTQILYGNFDGNGGPKPISTHPTAEAGTTAPGLRSTMLGEGEDKGKDEATTPSPPPPRTPSSASPAVSNNTTSIPPHPPPPPSYNTTAPTCTPSTTLTTADFKAFTLPNTPLPTPYLSLIYTGFAISNRSPPHLSSPPTQPRKSIAVAPADAARSFSLSSLALACEAPPCNITMYGHSVQTRTAQGGAAARLLTNRVRVEGEGLYTVVDGLEGKGWVGLEKVSFVVSAAEGGEEGMMGMGLDNVVYRMDHGDDAC
ncbi:MAG: hypothetical protein LQ345_003605 [Seirophora villosa]|nr:MAG: hypothetical protein LQ345_003605 [Seirophora villosa]